MSDSPSQQIARLNRHELTEMPPQWTDADRGQFLRMLLRLKGIDASRYFRVTYHPYRRCWLVSQAAGQGRPATEPQMSTVKEDANLYLRLQHDLARAARAAVTALVAQSPEFARRGCPYELPTPTQELTPAAFADLLGQAAQKPSAAEFDSEGGWQPSEN
jgi:hypothetical protein